MNTRREMVLYCGSKWMVGGSNKLRKTKWDSALDGTGRCFRWVRWIAPGEMDLHGSADKRSRAEGHKSTFEIYMGKNKPQFINRKTGKKNECLTGRKNRVKRKTEMKTRNWKIRFSLMIISVKKCVKRMRENCST